MRLRTFTAPDMPAAMKMVRAELGPDAIILTTEHNKGKKGVTITAAADPGDEDRGAKAAEKPAVAPRPSSSSTDNLRFELQNVLRFHNVPELFVAKMMRTSHEREWSTMLALDRVGGPPDEKYLLGLALEKFLAGYYSFVPLPFDDNRLRIMLVGAPGIGKTLTIAKIASRLTLTQDQSATNLTVITTDNKRAGGVEQLQAFTTILGLKLHVADSAKNLQKYIEKLPPDMQILVDTAGCNPYDKAELSELKALAATSGIEPVLVLPAGGDSLETIDSVESFAAMPIKRILITRADTARRFGGILAAAAAHGLSFCNVSGSSSIIDTLQPVDGAFLAQLLLRYKNN